MSANKAHIMAVLGASGSGKSTFVKREISRGHPRLLIWDPMSEYEGALADSLAAMLAALGKPKFRIVFRPDPDPVKRAKQFDLVCRAALAAGNMTLVVEELRFVTSPSRAPMGWAQVCLTGRHKGLKVYGLSQRPASIDKDFLGNCTRIRTGRLVYRQDVRAVADVIGQDDGIQNLKPLQWIERDMTTGKVSSGFIVF